MTFATLLNNANGVNTMTTFKQLEDAAEYTVEKHKQMKGIDALLRDVYALSDIIISYHADYFANVIELVKNRICSFLTKEEQERFFA